MATYTVDKIGYNNNEYVLQDSGALQLTGGSVTGPVTFGDSVSADDVSIGTLSVTGSATFTNNIQANTINGTTVGSSPKFTDTVTTVTTTGSGNAITAITASNGVITATKGTTFPTSNTDTTYALSNALSSHKFTSTLTAGGSGSGTSTATIELAAGTGITLTDDTTNKKITIASSVTNTDTKLQVAAVTSGTTYYPIVGTGTTAATRQYDTTGFIYKGTNGTTSAVGSSILTLGNSTASGAANNKQGQLVIYGSTAYAHTIQGAPTAARTLTLPNATGTIALTSDIPTVPDVSGKIDTAGTGLSKSGTTLNHSNSVTAQATQAVYPIKIDAQGHISAYGSAVTIPSVTLNGSSSTSPSFYAPTGAGTSGQYLKSSGTGAPTWTNFPTIPSITLNGSSSTSPSFYAPTSAGTSGYYLKSSGSGAPTWTAFPTIPTVPSAGTSASAVGTSASGGSASTYSKSDHVHNITSTTITSALGYTPYNSTNPNGYTSNVGTVTGVKVNGTTINPTSGIVDIGTVATSDTQVTQTSIISDTSDTNLDHNYRLVLSGTASNSTETNNVYKVDTVKFNPYKAMLFMDHSDTAAQPVIRMTNSDNYMDWLTAGSNWFNVNGTSTSSATAGIRLSQSSSSPYIEIFDNRSTATGNNDYRLFASGIAKVNHYGSSYKVQTNGTSSSLAAATWTNKGSFSLAAGTWLINVTGIWGYTSNKGIRCVRLTTTNSTSNPAAVTDGAVATMSQHETYENKCGFSVILAPTASTTYYIMMYSTTSNSAFASYSYFRLL